MRSPAVFAMILLGSSAVATAEPRREETTERVGLAPPPPRRAPSEWVELASPTPARHGTEFISVGAQAGTIGVLRIDAVTGRVPVRRVRVILADGKARTYRPNQRLDARRKQSLRIELPAASVIDRVIVTTDARSRGTYSLFGSQTGGVVATR